MEQIKEAVKRVSYANDAYNLMVFPDQDRWLWFVTFTSSGSPDSAHWGRFLGCGDAQHEKEAWERAKSFAEGYRKKS